jgi:hypothetical protein
MFPGGMEILNSGGRLGTQPLTSSTLTRIMMVSRSSSLSNLSIPATALLKSIQCVPRPESRGRIKAGSIAFRSEVFASGPKIRACNFGMMGLFEFESLRDRDFVEGLMRS